MRTAITARLAVVILLISSSPNSPSDDAIHGLPLADSCCFKRRCIKGRTLRVRYLAPIITKVRISLGGQISQVASSIDRLVGNSTVGFLTDDRYVELCSK